MKLQTEILPGKIQAKTKVCICTDVPTLQMQLLHKLQYFNKQVGLEFILHDDIFI